MLSRSPFPHSTVSFYLTENRDTQTIEKLAEALRNFGKYRVRRLKAVKARGIVEDQESRQKPQMRGPALSCRTWMSFLREDAELEVVVIIVIEILDDQGR